MTGKVFKESIIPGAISYAMRIGEILRTVRDKTSSGSSVCTAIAEEMSGRYAFRGKLASAPWEETGGFNIGEINLEGTGDFAGSTYRIWFKNENIIAWKNGKIDATVPDLICMIGSDGYPITTPNFTDAMEINILLLPSPEIWQTPEGLACFGPRHFGFGLDYVPFQIK